MPSANVSWPTPLTRFPTLFPGQMGVPGTDTRTGMRHDPTGAVYYVDPNHPAATPTADGTNPDNPISTAQAAVNKCRPYRGDVVCVSPSGYWVYSDLASPNRTPIREELVVTTPGIRIVGNYPSGALGVPWAVTQDGGIAIDVQAMDVLVEGFQFYDPLHTGVVGVRARWGGGLRGENLIVRHCFFYGIDYGVQLDWTYNCHIQRNMFQAVGAAAVHNLNTLGDPDYSVFEENILTACLVGLNLLDTSWSVVRGNHFLRCGDAVSMPGGSNNNVVANWINGDDLGAENFIDLSGGDDNMVADNWLSCTLAQYAVPGTCVGGATDVWVRNHCQDGETVANP